MADIPAEIQALLPDNTIGSITASNVRQLTNDMHTTYQAEIPFDPWYPPTPTVAKQNRTCVADYTFGTATTTLLSSVAPITNITQLNANFWNLNNFTSPIAASNGTATRYANEYQNYAGTTNMSFDATDLVIQATLAPSVVNNTELGNLYQASVTANNVTAPGSYTWTIAVGLDWQAGDPLNIDTANGHFVAVGTITSYTPGTGVLVANLTSVPDPQSSSSWLILRAMINSGIIRTKQTFLYGFVEASLQLPAGNGMGTQFWMYANNNQLLGGTNCENDILEQIINAGKGIDGTWSWCAVHAPAFDNVANYFDLRTGQQLGTDTLWHHANFDITSGFHKFQALWVGGYIAFYIDDVPFAVSQQVWKTGDQALADFADIILNLAVGNAAPNFNGAPNNINNFPGNLKCQYIRVWQSTAEAALGAYIKLQDTYNQLLGGVGLTSGWTAFQATFVTAAATDPDSGTNAARITEDGTTNFHEIYTGNIATNGHTQYTLSFKVKVGSSGTRNIWLQANGAAFVGSIVVAYFTTAGAFVSSTQAGPWVVNATGSTPLPGGWYQVWVTFTTNGDAQIVCQMGLASGSTQNYAGDAASNFLVYDPHLLIGLLP